MEQRPGAVHYATATAAVKHGAPVEEDGFGGIAVKQREAPAGTGLGDALIDTIQAGEAFAIRLKGLVYVDNLDRSDDGAFSVGDPVYIIPSSDGTHPNGLTITSTSNVKFGRVEAIAGSRGVATGKMRVNMDAKDTL